MIPLLRDKVHWLRARERITYTHTLHNFIKQMTNRSCRHEQNKRKNNDHIQTVPTSLQGDQRTCTILSPLSRICVCLLKLFPPSPPSAAQPRRGDLVPRTRRRLGIRAFCVAGPTEWNSLLPVCQTFELLRH